MHSYNYGVLSWIKDELIREGVAQAISKTLLPALTEKAYVGHYTVTADGRHFGEENTWPGLDSWEMAGAFLHMGLTDVVKNYFRYVSASQRLDGNIPFAIFPVESIDPVSCKQSPLHMIDLVKDTFKYPSHTGSIREYVGLFTHWQPMANPLSVLGSISYLLVAHELYPYTDKSWLNKNITSIMAASKYLLSRINGDGFMSGSGFYTELPPRHGLDGITQCYGAYAFRAVSEMLTDLGDDQQSIRWQKEGDGLAERFRTRFFTGRHFAEYFHDENGLVDKRNLTDVDFAAVGLNIATDEQAEIVWKQIKDEKSFWWGGMPTQTVNIPFRYEDWELNEALPFELAGGRLYDVAAMGRVFYLDMLSCMRLHDFDRLRKAVRLICQRGKQNGWYWYERYHAIEDGTAKESGPAGYCEYASVLVRSVLGNPEVFK